MSADVLAPREWEADALCRQVAWDRLEVPQQTDLCRACDHRLACYQLGMDVATTYGINGTKTRAHDVIYGGVPLDLIARKIGGRR